MASTLSAEEKSISKSKREAYKWMMIYSLEHYGGATKEWRERSGMEEGEINALQSEKDIRREVRDLQRMGRLFTLEMLFELVKQKAMEMLAKVAKPTEVKSLLGTLKLLRAVEITDARELERLAAKQQRQTAPPEQLATTVQ